MCRQGGRIATHKRPQFASIPAQLLRFAQTHDFLAQEKRRSNVAQVSGFTLEEARQFLFQHVPGLKEFGFSKDSVHRLMVAPRKGTHASKQYHGVVDARVTLLRNDDRTWSALTHYARVDQKLLKEWHALYNQPRISGDDMNTLQVGRPIVSRYHRNRRFFRRGQGVNHLIHDFPSAELGLKLGGFMVAQRGIGESPKWARRSSHSHLSYNSTDVQMCSSSSPQTATFETDSEGGYDCMDHQELDCSRVNSAHSCL